MVKFEGEEGANLYCQGFKIIFNKNIIYKK